MPNKTIKYFKIFSAYVDSYLSGEFTTKKIFLQDMRKIDHLEASVVRMLGLGIIKTREDIINHPLVIGNLYYRDDTKDTYGLFLSLKDDGYFDWEKLEIKKIKSYDYNANST